MDAPPAPQHEDAADDPELLLSPAQQAQAQAAAVAVAVPEDKKQMRANRWAALKVTQAPLQLPACPVTCHECMQSAVPAARQGSRNAASAG